MLRRSFLQAGLAASLSGCARTNLQPRARVDEFHPENIKLAHRVKAEISDDDLLFLRQLGLRWARVEFGTSAPYDRLLATRDRFARHGIRIFSAVHHAYRSLRIQLGQPGRDEDIETYRTFLRDLGRLQIPVADYDFHPGNTYDTAHVTAPRGYVTRQFDVSDFRQKVEKPRFDRPYEAEELWGHYTYFVRAVLPVAEQAGVRMALHPDDPPISPMNGVAKLLINAAGYARAESISRGSPAWGITFCVGTWSEGGAAMGRDVFQMIQDYGARGKIFDVHLRAVSGPLPSFVETLPDEGYLDLYPVMKALRAVRFSGSIVPDHVPPLVGDDQSRRAGTAYCIAYLRALLRRANEEVG